MITLIDQFLLSHCSDFRHERSKTTLKGFFADRKIQLFSSIPIKRGDVLSHLSTENKYTVVDVEPLSDEEYLVYYSHASSLPSINIGTIQGNAIVGNQQNAVFNIGSTLPEIREFINKSTEIDKLDRQQLQELIDLANMVVNNNLPITGGFFGKFRPLFTKYGAITGAIIQSLIPWLLNRNP